jgi:thiol-disulfide isomerase/thioredoxin
MSTESEHPGSENGGELVPPAEAGVPHVDGDFGGDAADAQPGRLRSSRKAAWLAMGAVALALALIWLAPGIEEHVEQSGPLTADTPGDPDDALATGKPAPMHFTLQDMDGANVNLASFKGKVVLINFWATWCGPCRAEIPSLVELQTKYRDDLAILGVSIDDTADKLKPYAAEFKMNYPVLVGNGHQDMQDAFGPLYGIPVSVIVGRDGRIAKKHSGIATKEQFEREIKALL